MSASHKRRVIQKPTVILRRAQPRIEPLPKEIELAMDNIIDNIQLAMEKRVTANYKNSLKESETENKL